MNRTLLCIFSLVVLLLPSLSAKSIKWPYWMVSSKELREAVSAGDAQRVAQFLKESDKISVSDLELALHNAAAHCDRAVLEAVITSKFQPVVEEKKRLESTNEIAKQVYARDKRVLDTGKVGVDQTNGVGVYTVYEPASAQQKKAAANMVGRCEKTIAYLESQIVSRDLHKKYGKK